MGDRDALAAELDYIKSLPGFERTKPQFFSDPMIDKLLEISLLLGGELWASRDRQMVMEHLLATQGKVTPEMIETFQADAGFNEASRERRIQFIQRIFGCLYDGEDTEAQKDNFQWLTKQGTENE